MLIVGIRLIISVEVEGLGMGESIMEFSWLEKEWYVDAVERMIESFSVGVSVRGVGWEGFEGKRWWGSGVGRWGVWKRSGNWTSFRRLSGLVYAWGKGEAYGVW